MNYFAFIYSNIFLSFPSRSVFYATKLSIKYIKIVSSLHREIIFLINSEATDFQSREVNQP